MSMLGLRKFLLLSCTIMKTTLDHNQIVFAKTQDYSIISTRYQCCYMASEDMLCVYWKCWLLKLVLILKSLLMIEPLQAHALASS